ncbi:MAG: hypothetical protein FD146_361 [Anaerolineaceae bacterium]|nr:MAG: hypothetical protein FD146_361 [Anaerolineaceae bacterium]
MNLRYLLPRLARHFLPERLTRFLLRRGWIIRPGLETREPALAAARYAETLAAHGLTLAGKRVLVFGYGGRFALGVDLLRRGAAHVVLCDRFAPPDHRRNRDLLPAAQDCLLARGAEVWPRPEFITLVQEDIRTAAQKRLFPPVDLALSASVFEHLPAADMDGITAALAALTLPGGAHLHFVDLRDHFFKYPFEMLTFSERAWRNWLNPTSNLNRFRLGDYRQVFESHFPQVEMTVLERDEAAFARLRSRVRPGFVTGDDQTDSVTQMQVLARRT